MAIIIGTAGDDTVTGPFVSDGVTDPSGTPVRPSEDNDTLLLRGGDDIGEGGLGNDELFGEQGNDTLEGGGGADTLDGGDGFNWLSYAADTVGVVVSLLSATATGGAAFGDSIVAGSFRGLIGGSGDDRLVGSDLLAEAILGGAGNDTLAGGGGDTLGGGAGGDSLAGGGGLDWLSYAGDTAGVNVNLVSGAASGGDAAGDTIAGVFRGLVGGAGNDTFRGGTGAETMEGGAGADSLVGGGGIDWLSYAGDTAGVSVDLEVGAGNFGHARGDLFTARGFRGLVGGAGDDILVGNDTLSDTLLGGAGNDALFSVRGPGDSLSGGAGNDTLTDGSPGPTLDGGAGDDTLDGAAGAGATLLLGGEGNDAIFAGDGDDTLEGGAGRDFLDGGDGANWLSYAGAAARVVVNLGAGTAIGSDATGDTLSGTLFRGLIGSGWDDVLLGNSALAETILGGGGDDSIGSMGPGDSLMGGAGDDTISDLSGGTTLDGGGDHDLLVSGIGSNGASSLLGGTGDDTLVGGFGSDTLDGGEGADSLFGGLEADALRGGVGNDTLGGGGGDDTMDGGGGTDRLAGGLGNDRYVLRLGSTVAEAVGGGLDTAVTALGRVTLATNVEILAALGGGARVFVGNDLDNTITGGVAADALSGAQGNDWLNGGAGNDTLTGGIGIDTLLGGLNDDIFIVHTVGDVVVEARNAGIDGVRTGLATYALGPNVENLAGTAATGQALTGNSLANAITGGIGADTLTGGIGADTLVGGAGADRLLGGADGDRYVVGAGDVVVEFLNAGQDTVVATEGTAWTLAANTEVLLLQGATLVTGVGNGLDNTLVGNALGNVLFGQAGADSLVGGAGVDVLLGGAGADTLVGGAQADRFRFDSTAESTLLAGDRIGDFAFAEGDRIVLTGIDANTTAGAIGNQAFAFIGAAGFTAAGQLRVVANGAGQWQALGDTDGDGSAELRIDIASVGGPVAGWFLL